MSMLVTLVLAAALALLPARGSAAPALSIGTDSPSPRPSFNLRALVPGLAQLDRHERVKGWIFIGLESAFLAGALELQLRADDLRSQAAAQLRGVPSRSAFAMAEQLGLASAQRFRFRDGFLVAAAAVWALSLVDGHLARPAPQDDAAEAPPLRDQPLMPTVCIERRGVVAGLSLKF